MNFVDAAVALLREADGPLHVEDLCRLALERGLLDSPGAAPLRSLKGRLTTELKRGPESRVVRVEDDVWGLADAGRNGTEESDDEPGTEPGEQVAAAQEIEVRSGPTDVDEGGARHDPGGAGQGELDEGVDELVDELDEEDDDLDDDDDEFDDEEDEVEEGEADEEGELDDDDLDDDEDDDEDEFDDTEEPIGDGVGPESGDPIGDDRAAAGELTGELVGAGAELAEAEEAALDEDDGEDLALDEIDHEALARQQEAIAQERAGLSLEEQELVRAYGDEAGTAQLGQLAEYRDHQTADEDRPMVPEILPERRGRGREDWKARRERMREKRRERREERERNKTAREQAQAGKDGKEAKESKEAKEAKDAKEAKEAGKEAKEAGERAGQPSAVEAGEAPRRDAAPAGEGDLARRACEVLASVKGAQPVPVRQLAQMMRKRRLVEVDPEVLWRPLKAALLADHQRRIAAGLPPRVAYRGRDLFSYRPSANAELEAAEGALETAAHRLRGATERAMATRLVELGLPVLEQVVQLYLVQIGWRDIEWIKRVDRSGYAIAREPGDGAPVLIGARAGNQEVDRRGVGELRAGVAAKNLARGLLLAPRELGADARAELEREGKPVAAMCGLRWACALVDAGIGVAQRAMPVSYLDPDLFDRLSEG